MKIKFIAFSELAGITGNKPVSSKKKLPEWFKHLPPFMNGDKKFKYFHPNKSNVTAKWCSPFLDSLSAGYMVLLEQDLYASLDPDQPRLSWRYGENAVDIHSQKQISEEAVPLGFDAQPYKFMSLWGIKTPRGYSCVFTHPMNRAELPFSTLTGIVDTDKYNLPVNFPFFIKSDFEGVIEAGTPIAQIIPVKRKSWVGSYVEYDSETTKKNLAQTFSKIYRVYKTFFWQKKYYN